VLVIVCGGGQWLGGVQTGQTRDDADGTDGDRMPPLAADVAAGLRRCPFVFNHLLVTHTLKKKLQISTS
jgi:hypothetical protein